MKCNFGLRAFEVALASHRVVRNSWNGVWLSLFGSLAQSKSILTHWSRECNAWREAKPYIHLNADCETVTWLKTRAGVLGVSQMWFNCGAVIGFYQLKQIISRLNDLRCIYEHPGPSSSPLPFFKEKQKQRRITSIELLSWQVFTVLSLLEQQQHLEQLAVIWPQGRKVHSSEKMLPGKTHWAAVTPQSLTVCVSPSCLASCLSDSDMS